MKDCLPEETLKLLSDRRLRGARLIEALKHLENCARCRARVRMPTKEELLKRLEPNPQDLPPAPPPSTSSKSTDPPEDKARKEAFKKLLDGIRGA
jgi:hypothetical protein